MVSKSSAARNSLRETVGSKQPRQQPRRLKPRARKPENTDSGTSFLPSPSPPGRKESAAAAWSRAISSSRSARSRLRSPAIGCDARGRPRIPATGRAGSSLHNRPQRAPPGRGRCKMCSVCHPPGIQLAGSFTAAGLVGAIVKVEGTEAGSTTVGGWRCAFRTIQDHEASSLSFAPWLILTARVVTGPLLSGRIDAGRVEFWRWIGGAILSRN